MLDTMAKTMNAMRLARYRIRRGQRAQIHWEDDYSGEQRSPPLSPTSPHMSTLEDLESPRGPSSGLYIWQVEQMLIIPEGHSCKGTQIQKTVLQG